MPAVLERNEVVEGARLSPREIVRAWEDRRFRASLSPELLRIMPDHPIGAVRLGNASADASQENAYSQMGSCDACSSSNCSSSNCSSDNCSSSNCSSDNCSSSNCSSNLCSNWNC